MFFAANRPGRFYLKSTHSLMLSISDKGRVRAELDITPETNLLEITFRLRSPATVVSADGEVDESGEELSRVWNDLDYADEHHSIAETQVSHYYCLVSKVAFFCLCQTLLQRQSHKLITAFCSY